MKLKATRKWNNEKILVKPVFFSWYVGIQYKSLNDYMAYSIFCESEKQFIFPIESKIKIFFLKIYFWFREWLWVEIRYRIPYRIRKRFFTKKNDDLPF